MAKKNMDTGYRVALTSARGIIRLLLYICGIVLIIYLGKTTYGFGYDVFNQKPVAASEDKGQDVTVIIKEGTSTYEIGKLLQDKNLINEGPLVFWTQARLSDYYGRLEPGSYILNTYQTVDEMLEILSKDNTEGQPAEEDDTSGDGNQDGQEPTPIPDHEQEGTEEGGE